MTKHVHAEMIKAKADNMELVVFIQQDKSEWEEVIIKNTEYIGDTLLFEREFKEVYRSASLEGNLTFYNRINGVIALTFNDDEYWVLVD